MKKIKKRHIIGFFVGLFTLLIIELSLNQDKYIDAFNKGYEKAHKSELRSNYVKCEINS
jgi:hypothetical protein